MKKFKKSKIAIIALTLISSFFIAKTDAYAKEMTPDEIPASSYVIGKYVFTRAKNEETGYNGALTTNLLMLASKSIESDNLEDMKVYYKLGSGTWIEGATGEELTPPTSFDVNYIDLQLEEENNTTQKPATPILDVDDSPYTFRYNTKNNNREEFLYGVYIILDAFENNTIKIDGIEIVCNDYNSIITREEIKREEFQTITIGNWNNEQLIKGRRYYYAFKSFFNTPNGYYQISARAYVEDANGKRNYSDYVYYTATVDTNLPPVEIINNYTNPKYIAEDNNYYVYKLGIKKPDSGAFQENSRDYSSLAYIVHETIDNSARQIGIYRLDEEFMVSVKKGEVVKYTAQLGYYDKNGKFQYFMTSNNKYFTIDTRELTAPVLNYNPAAGYSGPGSTPESIAEGEYIFINNDFYKNQPEDTLDYQIEGTEIYQIHGSTYELISDKTGNALVFPPSGVAYYVARVYATNAEGERIYSKFSDYVYVVRTPLITASEVVDGKVTITVDNIDEYWKDGGKIFTLYKTNTGTGSDVKLGEIIYQGSQEAKIEIPVTENMEVYMIASDYDWRNSTDSEDVYAESMSSNGIDIVLE